MKNPPSLSDYGQITLESQGADLAKELQMVMQEIPSESLMEALKARRWTGRPGHSFDALWKAYILTLQASALAQVRAKQSRRFVYLRKVA